MAPITTTVAPTTTTTVPTYALSGTVGFENADTSNDFNANPGEPCEGADGYSDLAAGGQVTISDGSGNLIATGVLRTGTTTPLDAKTAAFLPTVGLSLNDSTFQNCVIPFGPISVPKSAFYKVAIGHRQPLAYSFDQISGMNWKLALAITG